MRHRRRGVPEPWTAGEKWRHAESDPRLPVPVRVRRYPHVATAKMGPVETDMHGREDEDRE
jgi:hypothetical protein